MPKIISIIVILIITFCFLAALFLLSGLCYQFCATKIDDFRYPAPGKLINVGGHKIHSYCSGKGAPTVVLDAGLGANLTWWALVQKNVSRFARVCSFDRAGYGWSDSGKEPRTSEKIVHELHTLLHAMPDTPPPYILAGHSFGGANVRLYANTFPDEVFGVVLVDACHEKQYQNLDGGTQSPPQGAWERWKDHILESTLAHHCGISRWHMSDSMKPFFSDLLSDDLREIIIAKASTVKSLKSRDSECSFIHESLAQLQTSANMLENKPVIVITRGKYEGESSDASWVAYQKELANLSSQGKHIVAEKSGHMINVEQPEIIVNAIHELVKKYNENM